MTVKRGGSGEVAENKIEAAHLTVPDSTASNARHPTTPLAPPSYIYSCANTTLSHPQKFANEIKCCNYSVYILICKTVVSFYIFYYL